MKIRLDGNAEIGGTATSLGRLLAINAHHKMYYETSLKSVVYVRLSDISLADTIFLFHLIHSKSSMR